MTEDKSDMICFAWDSEIEDIPAPTFELMPEGDYEFTVTDFERGFWNGSDKSKVPPCKQATYELTFLFRNAQGEECVQKLSYRLRLDQSVAVKIGNFFNGIGLHTSGDGMKTPPWDRAVGCRGIAKITCYTSPKNGKEYSQVDDVYTKENAPLVWKNDPVRPASNDDIPF